MRRGNTISRALPWAWSSAAESSRAPRSGRETGCWGLPHRDSTPTVTPSRGRSSSSAWDSSPAISCPGWGARSPMSFSSPRVYTSSRCSRASRACPASPWGWAISSWSGRGMPREPRTCSARRGSASSTWARSGPASARWSMPELLRLGVLASGRGSNFEALVKSIESGGVPALVAVLVSDRVTAPALEIARAHGIEALFVDPKQYPSREAHEKAIMAALDERGVGLVCQAGYMRILGPAYIEHFRGRALNIHPSLLPAFPGLHAQRQALEHGAKITGATVHFADEGVDTGPIVLQAAVPVLPDDTEETLSRRILEVEHRIFPEAVRLFAEGRLVMDGRRVHIRERA